MKKFVMSLFLFIAIIIASLNSPVFSANPNLAGDNLDVRTVSTVSAVTSVTDVANISAGQIQTNAMETGYVGSQSVSVGTSVQVKVGALTAGTKIMRITTSGDLNYGGDWVSTGTGFACMTATGSPYDFQVATTTPEFYMMGKSASVSALIEHIK